MTNKKSKIINWLSVAISAVILILECMPKSVIVADRMISFNKYITSYHSYFSEPSLLNVKLTFSFIIAILTSMGLIINVVTLIKNNKATRITSIVTSTLLFVLSAGMMRGDLVTAYNVVIFALFLAQATSQIVVELYKENKGEDKRISILNLTSVIALAVAVFLEFIPKSVRVVDKFCYNDVSGILDSGFSYFFNYLGDNKLFDIAFLIALMTVCAFVLNLVSLAKNKRWLSIASLSLSAVCALSSIVIPVMAGNKSTPSNILLLILFIGLTALQFMKFKMTYQGGAELSKSIQVTLAILSVLILTASAIAQYFVEGAYVVILPTLMLIGFIICADKIKYNNKIKDKKAILVNWSAIIIMAIVLLLETLPNGLRYNRMVYEFDYFQSMKVFNTSYFGLTGFWADALVVPITISTLLALVFNIIALFVDKKSIRITALVCGALASVCNLVIMILYRECITACMAIIMALLIAQVVISSVILKNADRSRKEISGVTSNQAVVNSAKI